MPPGRAPTPRATSSGTASTPRTPPTGCSPTRCCSRACSSSPDEMRGSLRAENTLQFPAPFHHPTSKCTTLLFCRSVLLACLLFVCLLVFPSMISGSFVLLRNNSCIRVSFCKILCSSPSSQFVRQTWTSLRSDRRCSD